MSKTTTATSLAAAAAITAATLTATTPATHTAAHTINVGLTAEWQPLRPFIEGVTGFLPVTQIGPVTIGGGALAAAYYTGYNGITGFPGIAAAIVQPVVQAVVTDLTTNVQPVIEEIILSVAGTIPVVTIGPVTVGGGRYVNDFINGYEGVTGLQGVINDIGAQLASWTPPTGGETSLPGGAASVAAVRKASRTVAKPAAAAAAAEADVVSERSAASRSKAKADRAPSR